MWVTAAVFLTSLAACDVVPPGAGSPYIGQVHALPELTEAEKSTLLDVAELAISDAINGRESFSPLPEFADRQNRVYVILWQRGSKVSSWWSQTENLSETVYRATRRLLAQRRPGGAAGLDIHLQVLGPDIPWSLGGYRHGLDGVSMRRTRTMNIYPTWAVETNVRQDKLLERLMGRLDAAEEGEEKGEENLQVFYFPALHFSRPFGGETVTTYYRGSTPRFVATMPEARFRALHASAKQWLRGALAESGQFHYLFYPSRDEFPTGKNNMIRQLMASRALAAMAATDETLLPQHQSNLDYMFAHWYRERDDLGYIFYKDKSKLGANAMALRTLVYSPLFERYRPQAERLAAGILSLLDDRGAFSPWFIAPSYNYDADRLLTFYSGEALLALFEYYGVTGDEEVLAAARRSQDFYVERYVAQIDEYYYPAYVPWHAQSLSALHAITGESRYAEAVFAMTDKLLEIQDADGKVAPDTVGRFYNPATPQYGSPHSSSDAVYTEGLAYAYELAVLEDDATRAERYRRALMLGLHNLDNLQYRDRRMYFLKRPEIVEGALRIHATDNKIRVDTTQHALDAFSQVAELLDRGLLTMDDAG